MVALGPEPTMLPYAARSLPWRRNVSSSTASTSYSCMPGFVTAIDLAGATHAIFVRGGFADVSPAGLTILADEARNAADFSRTEIEQLIAARQSAADAATTPEEKSALVNELDTWKNLLLEASGVSAGTAH